MKITKTKGGHEIINFEVLETPIDNGVNEPHIYKGTIVDLPLYEDEIDTIEITWDELGRCMNWSREDCFLDFKSDTDNTEFDVSSRFKTLNKFLGRITINEYKRFLNDQKHTYFHINNTLGLVCSEKKDDFTFTRNEIILEYSKIIDNDKLSIKEYTAQKKSKIFIGFNIVHDETISKIGELDFVCVDEVETEDSFSIITYFEVSSIYDYKKYIKQISKVIGKSCHISIDSDSNLIIIENELC